MAGAGTSTLRTGLGVAGYGGQSMSAPLRRVLVRRPVAPLGGPDWREFGYVREINPSQARAEHDAFVQTLTNEGIEVAIEDDDPDGMLDAIFGYDPSIVTDLGAILLRLGKPLRDAEVALHERTYERLGIPITGRIEEPGTVEGGDTLWLDERTLAVGRGYRTNDHGIAQLTTMLGEQGVKVIPVELPYWHGPGKCLHLMSLISPVAASRAVVYLPLLSVPLVELLRSRGWQLLEVPDEEFGSLGSNVLALTPQTCLMIDGNPVTRGRLEAAGHQVLTYRGDEISHNRAGGPTCLTRPLLRSA
jgi:dimethylargininase